MGYLVLLILLALLVWFIVLFVKQLKIELAKTPEEKAYDAAVRAHHHQVNQAHKAYKQAQKAQERRVASARWEHEKALRMGDAPVTSLTGKEGRIEVQKLFITTPSGKFPLNNSIHAVVDTAGGIAVKSRTTVTRVAAGAVLFGPVGALVGAVAKKNKVIDTRQLYLLVEGDEFACALTLNPDQASEAHNFVAELLQTARQAPVIRADQKRKLEETQEEIERAQKDVHAITSARQHLNEVEQDTQELDAARKKAEEARRKRLTDSAL